MNAAPPTTKPIRTHPRPGWLAAALFGVVAAVMLLTMGGHTYSRDEETLFTVTETLARYGRFRLDDGIPLVATTVSPNGGNYAVYGPLKPLLQLPLYWWGNAVSGGFAVDFQPFIRRLFTLAFNPLVHAATAALLFLLIMRLGYRTRTGVFVALLFAFATFAFPHARTGFAEPLSALLLLLPLYLLAEPPLREGGGRGRVRGLAIAAAGACLALAMATKIQNLIVVSIFGVWLLYQAVKSSRNAPSPSPSLMGRGVLDRLLWFIGGFVLGYLPLAAYNWRAFGGPFSSGYGSGEGVLLVTPFFEGLYNQLLSPGKGLAWFALPLLLLPFALLRFWRAHRSVAAVCMAIALVHLLFYATNRFWHADGAWGPRYLATILPFALLPLAALVEDVWAKRGATLAKGAIVGLTSIAVATQLFGAAVNFDTYINQTYGDRNNDTAAGDQYRYFTLEGSPLIGHPRLLAERIAQWRGRPTLPAGSASVRFGRGWSVAEGASGLPRWTNGYGVLEVQKGNAYTLTMNMVDHRPPDLPRANLSIAVGGEQSRLTTTDGVNHSFVFYGDQKTLSIVSDRWNPAEHDIARDETLGVSLERIEAQAAAGGVVPLTIIASPSLPGMPLKSARQRFDWFYRPDYPHLLDHWYWYANNSGLSPTEVQRLTFALGWPIALLLISALGCVLVGRRHDLRRIVPQPDYSGYADYDDAV